MEKELIKLNQTITLFLFIDSSLATVFFFQCSLAKNNNNAHSFCSERKRGESGKLFFGACFPILSRSLSAAAILCTHNDNESLSAKGRGVVRENEQFTRFKKHVECRRRKSNKQRQKLLRLLPQSEVDLFRNAFLNNSCSMHFKLISYIFILEKIPLDQTLSITKNAVHFSVERQ